MKKKSTGTAMTAEPEVAAQSLAMGQENIRFHPKKHP